MLLAVCADDDTSSAFRIVSNPVLATDHNREWSYPLVTENGGGEAVRVSVSGPSWMALDTATATLRALAELDAIGVFPVQVNVSAGASRATQSFNLTVRLGKSSAIRSSATRRNPHTRCHILRVARMW